MKKNIFENYEPELERVAKKWLPTIHLKYLIEKRPSAFDNPDWWVSEEYLEVNNNKDQVISEGRNFYSFESHNISNKFLSIIWEMYPDYKPLVSGHFYYPPGGFMGWHTNSDKPEKHVYIVYASESNKSFFRYVKDGEVITDWDKKGINIREFDIVDKEPYFWHCVYSQCDRYSFGFRLFEK